MSSFYVSVQNSVTTTAKRKKKNVSHKDLEQWGLQGITLRSYQLDGVQWLIGCQDNQEGCILGDEMGLGKTCQTISLLVYMTGALRDDGPFLVLSPLSVMENWRQEMERFSPSLSVLCYSGDKDRRAELQKDIHNLSFHVLLTTYELCYKDASFLRRWKWKVLVVDEAHRLKNQNSLLHRTLTEFTVGFRVLLTGTPIQNNLQEVYALLSFIQPSLFPEDDADHFVSCYSRVQDCPALASELQSVLEPFLLRRVKSEVAADLPKKTELVVYHGMSALQKKYYKAILMKDHEAFADWQGNKTRLLNVLMQLRKCVDHPYLFDGVEPEPFEMGEHLIQASGKLCLLDSMLVYLHKEGHRVLLFSQMTRVLDILQDYMEYRGYSYERLDGSVRGEERNLAIKNFSHKDVFVFLLSTKAGGVGMNLTAADTVIFMDSDFNPQNDLQAAARCHRIGQNRAVKVIRLLGRDTVEEIVYSRAASKLRLTNTVIQEGRFSLLDQAQAAASGLQLSEILKFGVDKLLSSEESSVQEVDLARILGRSADGQWLEEEEVDEEEGPPDALEEEEEEEEASGSNTHNHMYYFEGRDYSRDPSTGDQQYFEHLLEEQLAEVEETEGEGRALRRNTGGGACLSGPLGVQSRKRKQLSDTELELRRQQRKESAAKRARLLEDRRRKLQEQKHLKKMAWWESCGYRSLCLQSEDSEEEEEEEEEEEDESSVCSTDSDHTAISYVLGDVTHPHASQEDAIIVHCVDDSGRWGRGGLFTALESRSDEPRKQYELAGTMKDLELGRVLLFPIDDKQSRMDGQDLLALIVAQQRDKANNLSGIHLSALDQALLKIQTAAKKKKASVHLPRIGHATKGFNWYGTERLIRKHLASKGVPTSIYYHSRAARNTGTPRGAAAPKASPPPASSPTSPTPGSDSPSRDAEETDAGPSQQDTDTPSEPPQQETDALSGPSSPPQQDTDAPSEPPQQETDAPSGPSSPPQQDTDAPSSRSQQETDAPSGHSSRSQQETDAPSGPSSRSQQETDAPSGPSSRSQQETDAPSGPSSRSQQETDAPSGPSSRSQQETDAPSGPSSRSQLPSFMNGVHVFFYNLPASERKRLARYLFTYDGDEEEVLSPEVTHIAAEVEHSVHTEELVDMKRRYPQAVVVQKSWLEACFSRQRKVNAAPFLHQLT